MKCPHCKTHLEITGTDRLETHVEHVCDPNALPTIKNKYQCTNESCPCYLKFVWNSDGDFYSFGHNYDNLFPEEMFSAYGSIARQLDVEVYKKTLPKTKYLHPVFMLWFFRPYITWSATSDRDGNILKKWWNIEILKRDESGRFCIGAHFCWKTWAFLWHQFKQKYDRGNYDQAFKPSMNRSWVNKSFEIFVKIRYFRNVPKHKFK